MLEACALFGCSHISGYIKLSLGWTFFDLFWFTPKMNGIEILEYWLSQSLNYFLEEDCLNAKMLMGMGKLPIMMKFINIESKIKDNTKSSKQDFFSSVTLYIICAISLLWVVLWSSWVSCLEEIELSANFSKMKTFHTLRCVENSEWAKTKRHFSCDFTKTFCDYGVIILHTSW